MKTKIKKDWYNREKSIEELHNDAILWKSEINFIHDEMRFLKHLLSSNYIDFIHVGLFKKIESFVNNISTQKKTGKTLLKIIERQELVLSDLISKNAVTDNKNFLKKHRDLQNELENYFSSFKENKKQIFKTVENVMREKNKKKLIS